MAQPIFDRLLKRAPYYWNRLFSRSRWKRLSSDIEVCRFEPGCRAEVLQMDKTCAACRDRLIRNHLIILAALLLSQFTVLTALLADNTCFFVSDHRVPNLLCYRQVCIPMYSSPADAPHLRHLVTAYRTGGCQIAGGLSCDWLRFFSSSYCLSENPMFYFVLLFGTLGGTLSAILSRPQSTTTIRIPQLANTFRVILLRILMGGLSAVILVMTSRSAIAEAVLAKNLLAGVRDTGVTLCLALAAGFS